MYVIPGPYHHSGRVLVSFRFDNDSHLDRRPRPDLVSVFLAPVGCRSDGVMRSMQLPRGTDEGSQVTGMWGPNLSKKGGYGYHGYSRGPGGTFSAIVTYAKFLIKCRPKIDLPHLREQGNEV